ncbi:MAG: glutamine amidotransferase [Symploca sp. SIO3C6]|nr:glutamine amidotransferase [Symploca sp. SIO3C6]
MSQIKEFVRTTCPRDCYDACGIVVLKRQGEIVRVKGDPEHPVSRGTLCGKCAIAYNGAWRDYPRGSAKGDALLRADALRDRTQRLSQPLKRIGAKGKGQFTPISWEEALDLIAVKLKTILDNNKNNHTPHIAQGSSILHTHYTGTCSLIAGAFPLRFFNRIGATEVDPDTVCNKAGHAALEMIFGDSINGFDPRTAKDAACILVWGANPSACAPHAHKHWLRQAPGKVIVIDPIRHPTAAQADLHLQPFPGSDGALAFALLHVIQRQGLIDEQFLANYTLGWEEILPLLPQCTPEWGEAVTGVPANLIEKAAKIYASGPSLLWLGQGLQRQATGGNVFRACSLLPIFTGNIGKPGAGFLYLNGAENRGIDSDYIAAPHLNQGESVSISHMDLAQRLEDSVNSQVLFCWNNNIVASSPEQKRLRKALAREDLFTVSVELFATDTTDYADIVLPAASFLEFDDLVISYFNYSISAQVKATEAPGEALPNQEIFRRLAAKMEFTEPELFESDGVMITNLLKQTGTVLNFANLSKIGTVNHTAEPVIQFAQLKFPTPSGKIEIVGEHFEKAGLSRTPQPFADARPTNGRLRVLSPASPWVMNSSYGNDAKIGKRLGEAEVLINPQEAHLRGLEVGNTVILSNDTGELTLKVALSEDVPCGVALVYKGRWPKLDPNRANVNVLNPGRKTDLAESSCVHSVEVEITPVSAIASRYPLQPSGHPTAGVIASGAELRSIASGTKPSVGNNILKTALCLRHVAFEDLGSFEPILENYGYQITYLEVGTNNLRAIDPLEADLLVVLGGPIGVYEVNSYPFLIDEVALLEKRLAADLPTLGLCLGSQLMAKALGAKVYPSGRKEIGWSPLILTEAGKQSPIVELAPELTPVLHWHGDTFDLPKGAIHLAASGEFQQQAFAWGKNCLGLQFHPEVTRQGLENWFIGHTAEINSTPNLSVTKLRADTQSWGAILEKQGAVFFKRWLESIEEGTPDEKNSLRNGVIITF